MAFAYGGLRTACSALGRPQGPCQSAAPALQVLPFVPRAGGKALIPCAWIAQGSQNYS